MWIILGLIVVMVILKLCQKYHICMLGFHDKHEIASVLNCNKQINNEMNNHLTVFHVGNKETHFRTIFLEIYPDNPRRIILVYDYVCIKCCKCYCNISDEKVMIKNHINKYVDKIKNKDIRRQIANDIYREKCKEKCK